MTTPVTVTFSDPEVVLGTLRQTVRVGGYDPEVSLAETRVDVINRAARLLIKKGKKPGPCLKITSGGCVRFDYAVWNSR
jgi:hypothetical protein